MVEDAKKGDLIYQHMRDIESLRKAIENARKEGLSDNEIKERILEGRKKNITESEMFMDLKKYRLIIELEE
jgi:hypothetical protein